VPDGRAIGYSQSWGAGLMPDHAEAVTLVERAKRLIHNQRAGNDAGGVENRLALLAETSTLLDGSLDYEATLAAAACVALPLLGDYCLVDLIGDDGVVRCVEVAHVDPSREAVLREAFLHRPIPGNGASTRVLEAGEANVAAGALESAIDGGVAGRRALHALREVGWRSGLLLPLRARGASIGALILGSTSDRPPADLAFAAELARRAALAIDNARLHEGERRARETAERTADRLARLQTLTAALSGALVPAEVAEVVMNEGVAALGAAGAAVALLDEATATFEIVRSVGVPADPEARVDRFGIASRSPLADAARQGKPILFASADDALATYPDLGEQPLQGALAALPLRAGERTLGGIVFRFADARPLDADRAFLVSLAELCAQALDRARLYDAERRAHLAAEDATRLFEESESRFQALAASIPQVVWTARPDGGLEYFNERWFELTGLTLDETEGRGWAGVVHAEDRALCAERWGHSIATGEPYELEHRLRRGSDGAERWHLSRAWPQRDREGRILRWFGTSADVHDLKQIQHALRMSESRFRRLAGAGLIGIVLWRDDEGSILDANDAFLDLLGRTRDDVLGGRLRLADLTPPEWAERDRRGMDEVRRTGVCTPYEKELLHAGGARIPVLTGGALLDGSQREGIAIVLDLKGKKQAERERAEVIAQEQAFREQILGIVGHDLRNPLGAITMGTAMMRKRGGLPPLHEKTLERISRSADRMARLIETLLDFTRSRIPLDPKPMCMRALCRELADELAFSHPDRVIELSGPSEGDGVWDRDRLAQVVSNLLGNALQHGSPDVPIRVDLRDEEPLLELVIHNDGPPIPADLLPVVFDPFRRGGARKADGSRSLGLGLFIVRQIVLAHGGSIDVRSTAAEGTTFTIRLPRRTEEPA
jgi:PAS domain S-box-containing protein